MSSNRIRVLLVSLLAVFAVSAVASASASAHQYMRCTEKPLGLGPKWDNDVCNTMTKPPAERRWEIVSVANGTKVEGTSGESILKSELDFVKLTIKCSKDTFSGDLDESGKSSHTVITYEGCALANPAGETCEVNATLPTNELKDELVTGSGSRLEDKFESEGTHFIEIEIKQKSGKTCTPKGTYPITGSQTCEVDKTNAEAETLAADHKIICSTTGSKLKLGPEKATYEGTATVGLQGGGNWAAE
jgi:hypothetical protein